uniref:SERTA domain-containing protein 3-like n=1 Tax=Pristiophorus japonicus TaxID=55135 RepID=UPI00398F8CD8
MVGKGVKRKRHADGGADAGQSLADCPPSYGLQRQLVLNTSLNKMQSGRAVPELSLRRTVLIANTLRRIQEEIRLESSQLAVALQGRDAAAGVGGRREPPPPRLAAEGRPDGPEDPAPADEDFSLSSAISSILRDLDLVLDGSPSPLRDASEAMDTASEDGGEEEGPSSQPARPLESVFGSFEIMSSSYLVGVTLDDLFLDIDTSVCDCDPAPGGRAAPAGGPDDPPRPFSSCNSSSLGTSPGLRTDLNDLDHIMEILVSS